VPSDEIKRAFIKKGVPAEKIKTLGTPIDSNFEKSLNKNDICKKTGLSLKSPIILVMGGTHGIGPDEKLITALDDSSKEFQVVVVAGVNKKLYKKIKNISGTFKKSITIMGFIDNVHELMEISKVIITKPGGLTTAEALAKSLPMIILNPLPGQESLNTKILTNEGIALMAIDANDAVRILEELLDNPDKIKKMQDIMKAHAKPYSASDIAEFLLKLPS
jgi:processive 1,2-diacylglycerol beta-glucosyltransferase